MTNTAHAVLGASSADRWISCPGSVRMSAGLPESTSEYAKDGICAHDLAALCLETSNVAIHYLGTTLKTRDDHRFSYTVTEEMVEAVQVYLDEVRRLYVAGPDGTKLNIERKFSLDLYPGMFGTNDASVDYPTGELFVIDFKYGQGKIVGVEDNPQLMYYALGAVQSGEFDGRKYKTVELIVVQPRAVSAGGPIRRDSFSVASLKRWGEEVLVPGAKATESPDAPLHTGEHCQFCRALAVCPKKRDEAFAVAQTTFSELDPPAPPAPETLSWGDLQKVLTVAPLIEAWLKACQSYARQALESGRETSDTVGFKLVQGRASRSWGDPGAATSFLEMMVGKEEAYTKKLISPAQAEKILKNTMDKQALKALFHSASADDNALVKESRGIQMVANSDPRPEIPRTDIIPFEEVEGCEL